MQGSQGQSFAAQSHDTKVVRMDDVERANSQ